MTDEYANILLLLGRIDAKVDAIPRMPVKSCSRSPGLLYVIYASDGRKALEHQVRLMFGGSRLAEARVSSRVVADFPGDFA
jgi:hypothetical protein